MKRTLYHLWVRPDVGAARLNRLAKFIIQPPLLTCFHSKPFRRIS